MTRSRQVQHRRDAILNAAESLVREFRATSFSMLILAEKAGISPATPYNLFGNKASILYALLNRSLDGLFEGVDNIDSQADEFEMVLQAADTASQFFTNDPEYYRPLYQYLLGMTDDVHRPAYMERAAEYWRRALEGLYRNGYFADIKERDMMARAIIIHMIGSLDLWIHLNFDNDDFRSHILHGISLLLLSVANGETEKRLRQNLRDISAPIPQDFTFSKHDRGNKGSSNSVGVTVP